METQLTEAQAKHTELETQLTESQSAAEALSGENEQARYTIANLEDAAAEYQTRIDELESCAAEAEARIGELTQAIETAQARIAELDGGAADGDTANHEAPAPAASAQPQPAQSGDGSPVVIVPAVTAPAAIRNADRVNMDDIYADIDRIVEAGPDSMSDEEKVAALSELKGSLNTYVDDLNGALSEISQQQAELEASADSISELEKSLGDAQTRVDELTAEIEQSNAAVGDLQAQIDALQAEHQSACDEADARIDALNQQMAEEQARVDALNAQLIEAQALLEKYEAQLRVYMLARDLSEGEAYTAATLSDCIIVEAGSAHASWGYANNALSGNDVVITLEMDGEELFRSAALKPGEALDTFELNRVLEAGEYEAVAIASVYRDGESVSATRVPVEIIAK